MCHNPSLLYMAVKSIALINKLRYCFAWIYDSHNAVSVEAALGHTQQFQESLVPNVGVSSFVKVSKPLFRLVWTGIDFTK